MVRAGLMEKIMSKINDTSYDVAATSERELTEAELELVSGGALSSAISDVMKNFGGALNTAARGG